MKEYGINTKGHKMLKLTEAEARRAFKRGYNVFFTPEEEYKESMDKCAGLTGTFSKGMKNLFDKAMWEEKPFVKPQFFICADCWTDC